MPPNTRLAELVTLIMAETRITSVILARPELFVSLPTLMLPSPTPLPARARCLLLACVFLLTAVSLRAEFVLSDLEAGPTRGLKGPAHVARIGNGYVVVWSETYPEYPYEPEARWLGASIVDDSGRILRTFQPALFRQGEPQFPAGIAASPDRVAVPGMCLSASKILSACVTWLNLNDGSISEPQLYQEDAVSPSIAWNGREFLLTFVSRPNTERTVGARVISPTGTPGPRIDFGNSYAFANGPAVIAAGNSFYVAWQQSVASFRVIEVVDGVMRGSVTLDTPADEAGPNFPLSLNAHGSEIIVVSGMGRVRLLRGLVPTTPWKSVRSETRFEMIHPRAVRTPDGWLVVFGDRAGVGARVRAVAIDADGNSGNEVLLDATTRRPPAFGVAASESGFIVAWTRDRHSENFYPWESDIVFQSFGASTVPRQAPVTVSVGIASQDSPVAAAGGGAFLAAWSERRGEMWQIRARRFSFDGQPLGAVLELPHSENDQTQPAIDFNGESFLLVWSEGSLGYGGIRGVRIDPAGTILDPSGIDIAGELPPSGLYETARVADVAWSGTSWMIVSEEQDGIGLRRLSASGLLLDATPVVLPKQGEVDRRPLIDCEAGAHCLVVWQTFINWGCQITCPMSPDNIVAARVTRDLQLLEVTHVMMEPGLGAYSDARNVAVAWNERQRAWLVVWQGLGGRRISASGALLDSIGFRSWTGQLPSLASDGDGWRLLWRESGSGLLAAWTKTGFIESQFPNSLVIASPEETLRATFLASGPRPLALYVLSRPELGHALRISGQFLPPRPRDARGRAAVRR